MTIVNLRDGKLSKRVSLGEVAIFGKKKRRRFTLVRHIEYGSAPSGIDAVEVYTSVIEIKLG